MSEDKNQSLFDRACRVIPGGVNSPVRAFGSVGGTPPFIESAQGCRIRDSEGREYIDYVGSWGPMLLGHAHPAVIAAIAETLPRGTSFGAPTEGEVLLAERICSLIPTAEMVRLVSSGTEATMTALRLARGATGRSTFIKFEGNYHGHGDSFLISAGSGAATHGHPSSPGVPDTLGDLTRVAPFNDIGSVAQIFASQGEKIAAVIVEPIAGNMGCVPPVAGFLEKLRELTSLHGALLIFDEVMTGFRVHPGGAQSLYQIDADLTCLGKIVGGGMPLGAVAGPRSLMELLSPVGEIYQAGTLSGNPLSVCAGLAILDLIAEKKDEIYPTLEERTERLASGFERVFSDRGIPHQISRVASMFSIFFSNDPIRCFQDVRATDVGRFRRFFHGMLDRGVSFPPSPFETSFVSLAHDDEAIDATIAAAQESPL